MFRKLLTFDEAKKAIETRIVAKPLGVEEVFLLESRNRVLAQKITAKLDIPPFDRSTVDGFAVKAEDTFIADENRPVVLRVSGTVNIGELPRTIVKKGEAAEIVTGAPIPRGATAVVMMEHTSRKDNQLAVYSAVAENENLMKAGSDIKKGQAVLEKGQSLGSREIGVLAALGKSKDKSLCGSKSRGPFNRARIDRTRQETASWKDQRHKRLHPEHGRVRKWRKTSLPRSLPRQRERGP